MVKLTPLDDWYVFLRRSRTTGKIYGHLIFPHPDKPGKEKRSSPIVSVDFDTRLVRTHSDRVYLLGESSSIVTQDFPFEIDFELCVVGELNR